MKTLFTWILLTFLVFTGSMLADVLPPPLSPHFEFNLNTPIGSDSGSGGWSAGQGFSAFLNTGTSTEGFTPLILEAPCPYEFCDPDMVIDDAGFSEVITSLEQVVTFNANDAGGGTVSFVNFTGSTITDLLITTSFVPPGFDNGDYNCLAGPYFSFCGFSVDESANTLSILYTGGAGIPTDVPEPGTWILLGTSAALLLSRRSILAKLRRRA
jgi:hypothetical protein